MKRKFVMLMAMLCMTLFTKATDIQVTTKDSSNVAGWLPTDPLPACSGTNYLIVNVKNVSATGTGAFTLVLLSNNLLTFTFSSATCGTAVFENDSLKISFSNIAAGDSCKLVFVMDIPCSVTGSLSITKSLLPGSSVTIVSDPTDPISFELPKMLIDSFFTATGTLITDNDVQAAILTTETYRDFLIKVTNGRVEEFLFSYTPEHEIEWDRFEFQAYSGATPVSSVVTYTSAVPFFNSTLINSYFGRPYLINGDRFKVREYFRIDTCSIITDNTKFEITWYCPNQSPNNCGYLLAKREISVAESGGSPSLGFSGFSHPFQVCGDTSAPHHPTTFSYTIGNTNGGAQGAPGSDINSIHRLRFPIDTSWFTCQDVILVSDMGDTLTSFPPGFLTFQNNNCYMYFDTLTGPLFPNNSPIVDTFLKDGRFNEIITDRFFRIIFVDCQFHCHGNQGTNGLFDACRTGTSTPMFFAQAYYDGNFFYDKMCTDSLYAFHHMNNYNYNYETETIAESDRTDVELGQTANLDYHFSIIRNPFTSTSGAISCDSTEYFPVIEVPSHYTLDSVRYFQDANSDSSVLLPPLYTGVTGTGDSIYRLQADSMRLFLTGRIIASVRLTNCTINTGGYDTIRIKHYAVCDSCYDCGFAMRCNEIPLYFHCNGTCDGPAANTSSFTFDRGSFGWVDSTMTNIVDTSGTVIRYNRAYPCDSIYVDAMGSVAQSTYVVDSIYFRIDYVSPSNFQYFEFVSGFYEIYDSVTNILDTFPITSTDLLGNWNSLTCTNCRLKFNFPPAIDQQLYLDHKASVRLHAVLKVKQTIPTPVSPPYYNFLLPQVRGQYISVYGSIAQESCDSWGDNMLVMNVRTIWDQRSTIYPGTAAVIAPENWASEEGAGYGYYHSLCERRFLVSTQVVGGYNTFDDFPNEFRPITLWPDAAAGDTLRLEVPPALTLVQSRFNARGIHGYSDWRPANVVTNGNELKIWGFDGHGWPVIEHDGHHPIVLRLSGQFTNACPPDKWQADTIVTPDSAIVQFPYTNRAYSREAACAQHDSGTYPSVYSTVPYTLQMYTSIDTFKVYSTIDSLNNINIKFFDSTAAFGPWIRNVWVYPLNNANCTVTGIKRGTTYLTENANFYQVDGLGHNVAQTLMLRIQINSCTPDTPFELKLVYGYECAGYPNDINATASCKMDTITLLILPKRSALALTAVASNTTVESCDTLQYTVTLTSTDFADTENPSLLIVNPPGLQLVSTTCTTSSTAFPGGTVPFITSNDSNTVSINTAVYNGNGMPGGGHVATLQCYFVPVCGAVSGTYNINFNASATNICNGDIIIDNDSLFRPVTIQNTLLPLTGNLDVSSSFTNCSNPWELTIALDNLQYNGQLQIQGTQTLPAGFAVTSSTLPVTGTNPVAWVQTQSGGTTAGIGISYSVPAGFCGIVPVQTSILLIDSINCTGTVNCIDSLLITRVDSIYVCCDTCNLSVTPIISHQTCENDPNGSVSLSISNGHPPYTYLWNTGAFTPSISGLTDGTYTCVITDSLGCVDSITAVVQDLDSLIITISPHDTVVCANTPVTLTATGCTGCTYIWYPGGETTQSIVVTPTTDTWYGLDVFRKDGCWYKAYAFIKVKECEDESECLYVYNRDYKDEGNDIEVMSDKGFVAVGSMYRTDLERDAYFVKYDGDFNLVFAKRIGESNQQTEYRREKANAVIEDAEERCYYFTGLVEISPGNTDVYVVKVNNSGGIVWGYRYGTKYSEAGTGIHLAVAPRCGHSCKKDRLVITGYSNAISENNYQFMAMQVNPVNGALVKVRVYNMQSARYAKSNASVLLSDNESIVLVGEAADNAAATQKYIAGIKIDTDLNPLVSNNIDNTDADEAAYNIIELGESVYVVGRTNAFADKTPEIYLLELNSNNLSVANTATYGFRQSDEIGYGLTLSSDQQIVITGTTKNNRNNNALDGLLLKVRPGDLSIIWERLITERYNQVPRSITLADDEGFGITGVWGVSNADEEIFVSKISKDGIGCCYEDIKCDVSKGYKEWRPDVYDITPEFSTKQDKPSEPYYDFKLICENKSELPAFAKQTQTPNEIHMYPNPNSGTFQLVLPAVSNTVKVSMFDLQGRKVNENRFRDNKNLQLKINADHCMPGVYFVEVITNTGKWIGKLIVSR